MTWLLKKANAILGNITVLLSRPRELIVPLYYILSQAYLEYYVNFTSACHKLGGIFHVGENSREREKEL